MRFLIFLIADLVVYCFLPTFSALAAEPSTQGYEILQHKVNQGRRFEWTRPDLGASSTCVELDEASGGEKYRLPVEDENCPKIETVRVWSTLEDGKDSRCYSLDSATNGQLYRRLEKNERCTKPLTKIMWLKTAATAKESCFEVDSESQGLRYVRAVKARLCPHTIDPYVAFGRHEPFLNSVMPAANKAVGGRMPASLAQPIDAEEARDPKEFWEDPEDMIRHVPDDSRKGQY